MRPAALSGSGFRCQILISACLEACVARSASSLNRQSSNKTGNEDPSCMNTSRLTDPISTNRAGTGGADAGTNSRTKQSAPEGGLWEAFAASTVTGDLLGAWLA